jgi:hypothetical protein
MTLQAVGSTPLRRAPVVIPSLNDARNPPHVLARTSWTFTNSSSLTDAPWTIEGLSNA